MRNIFLKLIVAATVFTGLAATASFVYAIDCSKTAPTTTQEAIQCGTDSAAGAPANATPGLDKTIHNIVNVLSIVVGIAAVIMIMVGGLRYVTSGGKEDSIKGAKNTIVYALIGLIVVALAQVVVRFVLNKTIQPPCINGKTTTGQKCRLP